MGINANRITEALSLESALVKGEFYTVVLRHLAFDSYFETCPGWLIILHGTCRGISTLHTAIRQIL